MVRTTDATAFRARHYYIGLPVGCASGRESAVYAPFLLSGYNAQSPSLMPAQSSDLCVPRRISSSSKHTRTSTSTCARSWFVFFFLFPRPFRHFTATFGGGRRTRVYVYMYALLNVLETFNGKSIKRKCSREVYVCLHVYNRRSIHACT